VDFSDVAFHDKLEARLWQLGRQLLRLGQPVIFERGLWQRSERDEMRREARDLGVRIELHYFDVPVDELTRRLGERNAESRSNAFQVTGDEVREYAAKYFQPPDADELALYANVVVHGFPVNEDPARVP